MRRPFLQGVLWAVGGGVVLAALAAVIVLWSGVIPVAASSSSEFLDRILGYASTQSVRHHAPKQANPLANDPAAIQRGLAHYREMCVPCHGGPGAAPAEFVAGLHPPAPDLASAEIQAFTDGMLYETVAHGIGSTGMPAFGATHEPNDIWSIVAFVRRLRELTPEQRKALGRGEQAESAPRHENAPVPAGGNEHHVAISGSKFDPPTLDVHVGDAVVWVNNDFVPHTATADDRKSFDTGKIDANASKRVIMTRPGTFPYFCRYHTGMKGTLTVK